MILCYKGVIRINSRFNKMYHTQKHVYNTRIFNEIKGLLNSKLTLSNLHETVKFNWDDSIKVSTLHMINIMLNKYNWLDICLV